MIIKRNESAPANDTSLIMLLYGAPGVGKTTLACSAEAPFVIDCDHGIKRVSASNRADYSDARNYTEILADVKEAKNAGYKSIAIDTIGALLDSMTQYIIAENPKMAQSDGTLTLKAYGVLKNMFLQFSADVRASFKNTIYICHEYASRDGDNTFYDLVIAGSTKQLIWQPVDLGARLHIRGGKRYLGFTPTEEYNAKSSFGIKGLVEVPELTANDKNDFLTRLFERARNNIAEETAALAPKEEAYKAVMKAGTEIIEALSKPEDVPSILEGIGALEHSLTSEKELKNLLKKKMADLKIVYDKASKSYKYAE